MNLPRPTVHPIGTIVQTVHAVDSDNYRNTDTACCQDHYVSDDVTDLEAPG